MYDIQEALLADESTRVFLKINDTWIEFYGSTMQLLATLNSEDPIKDYPNMNPTPISIQEALGLIQEKNNGNFPDLPDDLFDN